MNGALLIVGMKMKAGIQTVISHIDDNRFVDLEDD